MAKSIMLKYLNSQYDTHKPSQKNKQKRLSSSLTSHLSNRIIQRLLAQRTDHAPTELDDTTADRIKRAQRVGQSLDTTIQQKLGETMGNDFRDVRVHTDSESHQLNEQLGAKAFTTGQDLFFREGEYNPSSSSGQELIAHELTHVVQQRSGAVASGSKMAVNAPGDRFEQEANAVAKQVTSADAAPSVQRQVSPEEEEPAALQMSMLEGQKQPTIPVSDVQRQEEDDEDSAQALTNSAENDIDEELA